jgi:hypothetical protein
LPEFEHVDEVEGQQGQKGLDPFAVERPARRKLVEDRPHRLSQAARAAQEKIERLLALLQFLGVGDEARGLDRIAESGRRLILPLHEGLGFGKVVETGVELDRVEGLSIMVEPALHRQFLGIESAAPVAIIPARAADPDRSSLRHRRA